MSIMDAVIYARISSDQEGRGLGVERQIADCTAMAQQLGWNVSETYVDNDLSASKAVPRPEYKRLMQDVTDGHVQAIVVYDLDRLTRKIRELEDFIDLTGATGVALANVSGDVDLTTANGKMIARIKGSVAAQEADRIRERTTRQKRQYAESGKRLGGRYRTFGYDRQWQIIEEEAALVREVFTRLVAGESQNSITRDFRERAVLTSADKPWTSLATSRLARNPVYAGINVYKGVTLGKTLSDPIVDEATFTAVNQPKGTSPRAVASNTRKHLLSGFLLCDVCKTKMYGMYATNSGTLRYRCDTGAGGCGKISIKGQWVDDLVEGWMSQVSVIDSIKAAEAAPIEQEDVEALIRASDERITALQDSGLDLEDLVPMLKSERQKRAQLVSQQATRIEVDIFDAVGEYADLDLSRKRGRIAQKIKYITVKRGKSSRYFDNKRLTFYMQNGMVMPADAFVVDDWRVPANRPGN